MEMYDEIVKWHNDIEIARAHTFGCECAQCTGEGLKHTDSRHFRLPAGIDD